MVRGGVHGISRGSRTSSDSSSHVVGQSFQQLRECGAGQVVDVDSGDGLPVEAYLTVAVDADSAQRRVRFGEERLSGGSGVVSTEIGCGGGCGGGVIDSESGGDGGVAAAGRSARLTASVHGYAALGDGGRMRVAR